MNLTTLLAALGMGDGEGNTSSKRVILILVTAVWLLPKVVNAIHGQPVTFEENDRWILGMILGGGVANTVAEKTNPQPKP